MPQRTITPTTDAPTLVTGHWTRGNDYRNWRPAGTRDHLLIYTRSGAGLIKTTQKTLKTRSESWTLFTPHTPQDYRTDPQNGTWELIWAHFHPPATWRAYLDWPEFAPGCRHLHLHDSAIYRRVQRHLQLMVRHSRAAGTPTSRTPHPYATELAMNALEAALLYAAPIHHTHPLDSRLRPALDLLHARFDQPWTVEQLADVTHLSVSRFAHLFRDQLGLAPLQYLEAQRLQRAKQLLEHTGMTITQISDAVGFSNPFYFSRRFRLATGHSPRDYRNLAGST